MPRISYAEVRQAVSLADVLVLIGYRSLRRQGMHNYGRCPLGCSADSRVCSFDLTRSLWRCHRCKRGGNQLDLYAAVQSLDLFPAAVALCKAAAVPVPWIVGLPIDPDERSYSTWPTSN